MAQMSTEDWLARLVRQESGGNPNAISPKGAAGIMQVMPATGREIAAELGEMDIAQMDDASITRALLDPARGKRYGEHYAKKQLAAFGGDPFVASIAYNAGPKRAQEFLKHRDLSRLPRETQGYVSAIFPEMAGGSGAGSLAGGSGSDGMAGYAGLLSGGGAPQSGGSDPFPQASGREKWATWLMGLGQAFRGNADPRYLTAVSELENKGVNENKTYKALISRGIDPATAEWAVRDPRVMQQLAQQLFAPKASKAMTVQEIFDPATGQPQKVLFDQVTGEYQPIGGTKTADAAIDPVQQRRLEQADQRIKLQERALEQASQSRRTRQLSVNDVEKLSKTGGELQQVQGFGTSFQDKYGGFSPWGDETRLGLGRMGLASEDTNEAAGWWQGYDRYKNVVRNELFGASLTEGEQQAFEKADITPSMGSQAIKDNLSLQSDLVKKGVMRRAKALVAAGYDPAPLAEAFGVPVNEIMGGEAGQGGAGAGPAAQPVTLPSDDAAAEKMVDEAPPGTVFIDPSTGQQMRKP